MRQITWNIEKETIAQQELKSTVEEAVKGWTRVNNFTKECTEMTFSCLKQLSFPPKLVSFYLENMKTDFLEISPTGSMNFGYIFWHLKQREIANEKHIKLLITFKNENWNKARAKSSVMTSGNFLLCSFSVIFSIHRHRRRPHTTQNWENWKRDSH